MKHRGELLMQTEKAGDEFLCDTFKKELYGINKKIETKKIRQNINNMSIIEIQRQSSLLLFEGIR
jgi:hypothetical protein